MDQPPSLTGAMALSANPPPPPRRDAVEGKGPQRWPQKRLGRRLEEVAEAVGGGYCRLQMPLRLALGVRLTVAGHRLGAPEGGGGGSSPSNASLPRPQSQAVWKATHLVGEPPLGLGHELEDVS